MLIKKFVGFLQTANYFLLRGVQKNCSYFFKQIDFISIKFRWTLFIMGEERLFILTFKEIRENVLFCWPHSPSLPRPFAEFRVQKIWTIFPQFSSLQYCGFQPDSALLVLTLLCLCVCVCVWALPHRSCWTPLNCAFDAAALVRGEKKCSHISGEMAFFWLHRCG